MSAPLRLDCVRGVHGDLIDGEPQIGLASVQVDRICANCQAVVGVVSWTRKAWNETHLRSRTIVAGDPR